MLLELLPSKLVFPPHSPPLNLAYFPDYVRNPDEIPSIQCSLFLNSWVFTGSRTWENPFFFFLRERSSREDRIRDLTAHNNPVSDAIVRKYTKNVTQQMLLVGLPSNLLFPPHITRFSPHVIFSFSRSPHVIWSFFVSGCCCYGTTAARQAFSPLLQAWAVLLRVGSWVCVRVREEWTTW